MTTSLRMVLLAGSLVLAGCTTAREGPPVGRPLPEPEPVGPGRPGGTGGTGMPLPGTPATNETPRRVVGTKRVREKRGISELVATDWSTCEVSEQKFRDTEIGESVTCTWIGGRRGRGCE